MLIAWLARRGFPWKSADAVCGIGRSGSASSVSPAVVSLRPATLLQQPASPLVLRDRSCAWRLVRPPAGPPDRNPILRAHSVVTQQGGSSPPRSDAGAVRAVDPGTGDQGPLGSRVPWTERRIFRKRSGRSVDPQAGTLSPGTRQRLRFHWTAKAGGIRRSTRLLRRWGTGAWTL